MRSSYRLPATGLIYRDGNYINVSRITEEEIPQNLDQFDKNVVFPWTITIFQELLDQENGNLSALIDLIIVVKVGFYKGSKLMISKSFIHSINKISDYQKMLESKKRSQ